jgi:hypothetical protein
MGTPELFAIAICEGAGIAVRPSTEWTGCEHGSRGIARINKTSRQTLLAVSNLEIEIQLA